jgi:hypothetical protein
VSLAVDFKVRSEAHVSLGNNRIVSLKWSASGKPVKRYRWDAGVGTAGRESWIPATLNGPSMTPSFVPEIVTWSSDDAAVESGPRRATVTDVLEYLASGMSEDEIVRDFPDLTIDDVRACLAFAADRERRLMAIPAE